MTDDAPVESPRSTSWTWWIFWFCFLVLVVYPLGLGPAALLHSKGILQPQLEAIYKPLEILYDKSPNVQPLFDRYLELWGVQ